MNAQQDKNMLFTSAGRGVEGIEAPAAQENTRKTEKILLVLNPVAGKGRSVDLLGTYLPELAHDGVPVTIYFTQTEGDGSRFVAEHGNEYSRIIIAGGDGSLNELVTGVLQGKIEADLGYLPTGTVCDFAATLGLPRDMAAASAIARFGTTSCFDVGKFNQEQYFIYVASFGAFTDSSYDTPTELKNTIGRMAYLANALKNLSNLSEIPLKAVLNGQTIEGKFLLGAVLNSTQMGGIVRFDPEEITLDDGFFEVLLVRFPQSAGDVSAIINGLMNQDYANEPFIFTRTKKVHFSFTEETAFTLDGEFGGAYREVDIEVVNKAWKLTH